jgi:hypothetical protein
LATSISPFRGASAPVKAPELVNPPGDELFACPRLPENQHIRVGGGDAVDEFLDALHRGGHADDIGAAFDRLEPTFEGDRLMRQGPLVGHALQDA